MLQQLIGEIQAGGSFEIGRLAAKMGASPQLIEAMLGHLQRLGHLQGYSSCADGCGGCGLLDTCGVERPVRLWKSTTDE